MELRRTGNNLPSRLADNFFWLGRYSERADATARLLRSALQRFNPERGGGAQALVGPLLQTLEIQGQLPDLSARTELRQNAEAFEAELLAAIFDPTRPGSLRATAEHLQRLATHRARSHFQRHVAGAHQAERPAGHRPQETGRAGG